MAKTPYEILGIDETATQEDVKKAYRTLAKNRHPDIPGGTVDGFTQIQKAYELLSDKKRRNAYDVLHGVVKTSNQQSKQTPYAAPSWNIAGSQNSPFVNAIFQQAMSQQAQASHIGMTGNSAPSRNTRQRKIFNIPRIAMLQARVSHYPMYSYSTPKQVSEVEITIDCSNLTDFPMPGDLAKLEFDMAGTMATLDAEVLEVRYYPQAPVGGIMGEIKFRTQAWNATYP